MITVKTVSPAGRSLLLQPNYPNKSVFNKLTEVKIAENLISQANISAISKWELFKYECRKFSIKFGKNRVSVKNMEITELIRKMSEILKNTNLGEDDKESLYTLQSSLDDLFLEKARAHSLDQEQNGLSLVKKTLLTFST